MKLASEAKESLLGEIPHPHQKGPNEAGRDGGLITGEDVILQIWDTTG